MADSFKVLRLADLPWPHGLGKADYAHLERDMHRLMGEQYFDPDANRSALNDCPEYREIARRHLRSASWSRGFVDLAARTTEVARRAPLLGRVLHTHTEWNEWAGWARPYRSTDRWVYDWMVLYPFTISDGEIGDGRHRITWLRLQCPPTFEVLVNIC